MKLTEKDRQFLQILKQLVEDRYLNIELKDDGIKRLVLKQNCGDRIERAFGMTRQGVRWRFQRIFSKVYVSAYETIYLIESLFGIQLRSKALSIARERVTLRKKADKMAKFSNSRRQGPE